MKKLLVTLLFGTLLAGGCNFKRGSTQMQEIFDMVSELGVDNYDFLYNAGIDSNEGAVVVKHYFPTSGRNRVVLGFLDTDGDEGTTYAGLDLSGYNTVLKDIEGLEDGEKVTALEDFISNAYVDDLAQVGDFFYEVDSGELFSEKNQKSKDLEGLGAKIQANGSSKFASKLTSVYGLSTDRAEKVAKLVSQYQKLSTKRSLTTREQNFYARELLGVDYNNVVQAMTMTQDERNNLMEKAAEVNGTSSEQISAIINEMFL